MLDQLADAIESLEITPRHDELVAAFAWSDRLEAKVTSAFGDYVRVGGTELDGATSPARWLEHEARLTRADARIVALTALRVNELRETSAAWRDGCLSTGQVHTIANHVTAASLSAMAEAEAVLVPQLAQLGIADTNAVMTHFARTATADGFEPVERAGTLQHTQTGDGTWHLTGHLNPIDGLVIDQALNIAITDNADGETRCHSQRRADASVAVHQFFLDHHTEALTARRRPHVTMVLHGDHLADGTAEADHGGRVPIVGSAIERLLCDCEIGRAVLSATGELLDYGRRTRTIPRPLRHAVETRDRHCRHAGCDRPGSWCEVHHVNPWLRGGHTAIGNLVLLCSRHHHRIHQPGMVARLDPDGTLHITDPNGRTSTTHPPGRTTRTRAG